MDLRQKNFKKFLTLKKVSYDHNEKGKIFYLHSFDETKKNLLGIYKYQTFHQKKLFLYNFKKGLKDKFFYYYCFKKKRIF